jgi:predicted ATP-dependent serine protease
MFYTLKKISVDLIEATSVEDRSLKTAITPQTPKWSKVVEYLEAGKLLSVSESGTWSGRKDYEGYYKKSAAPKAAKQTKIKLTKLDDLNFSDDLFKPLRTGLPIDQFLSNDGGFMPGSNIMAAGAPGVGKTTVLLETLWAAQNQDPTKRVLFISAEMNQLDMARYLKRFPHWGQLPILFLSDYVDQDPQAIIESVLAEGYDLVLTDSYTEVNDTVKEECNMTRGKTEKWFLDMMIQNNQGKNKRKVYTTFITILQLSKGGTFVGSNKLKHMTTAMLEINWKGGENSAERFMEFSKNRLGQVGHKLFFDFSGGVNFDTNRYKRDLLNQELIAEEKEKLKGEEDAFDRLFGALPNEAEAITADPDTQD